MHEIDLPQIDHVKIAKDTSINAVDLSGEFVDQSRLYSHYGSMFAVAQHVLGRRKLKMDIVEAQIDARLRDQATLAGEKITEALIGKRITADPDYIRQRIRVEEAKFVTELLEQVLNALKHKKDMLIQLGLKEREEMKGDLSMRERSASEMQILRDRARAGVENLIRDEARTSQAAE